MHVDPADPPTAQARALDEFHHFIMLRNLGGRQRPKQGQDILSVTHRSARDLTNDERMRQDLGIL